MGESSSMLAHIAGAPVEETALSLAPVAFVAAGLVSIRLRRLVGLLPAHAGRATDDRSSGRRR